MLQVTRARAGVAAENAEEFGTLSSNSSSSRLPWALAWRLAVGQIVAWGILYYAFTVIVGPMQAGTGWSRPFLNSGLSIGLLAWGVVAYPVGVWIQRHGARGLMTAASALGGGSLILMGSMVSPIAYVIAWAGLGSAMAGMLYDPAFAVITRAFGEHYRRGITLVTLVGGLASTVFIPLAQLAVDTLGWRAALIALGVFKFAVGVPLHHWGLPRTETGAQPLGHVSTTPLRGWFARFRADVADPRFVGLALWFASHSAVFTGLIFQLVSLFQARGVPTATILTAIAVIGPMQVLGRFFFSARASNFSSLRVGRWALGGGIGALTIALIAPPSLFWLVIFAACWGLSNGLQTIVRGTAVAELFGRERYAEINGALAAPSVLARAAAPLVFASAWTYSGQPGVVFAVALVLLGLGTCGLFATVRATRRLGAAEFNGASARVSVTTPADN